MTNNLLEINKNKDRLSLFYREPLHQWHKLVYKFIAEDPSSDIYFYKKRQPIRDEPIRLELIDIKLLYGKLEEIKSCGIDIGWVLTVPKSLDVEDLLDTLIIGSKFTKALKSIKTDKPKIILSLPDISIMELDGVIQYVIGYSPSNFSF